MEDFNPAARLNASYLIGAYLAVNSVTDARILIDGPDCVQHKAEFIDRTHDSTSTLVGEPGRVRVLHTSTDPSSFIGDREARLADMVARTAGDPGCGVLFFSALPFCSMAGTDYDRILRTAGVHGSSRVVRLPSDALSGDWLDGYADVLCAIARTIPLRAARRHPAKVALVGYLFDRGEEDHRANLRELGRLLGEIGLDLVSIWPQGDSYARFAEVSDAGTILALPYARQAAAVLAERLNIPVVEVPLPFGLRGSERWLAAVANACGREKQAHALLERELRPVLQCLEGIVPRLLHMRTALAADPFLLAGLGELCDDLGMEVVLAGAYARPGCGRPWPLEGPSMPPPLFEPVRSDWDAALDAVAPDLLVAGSHMLPRRDGALATVEFGFPSYSDHAFVDRPFICWRGCLGIVERMFNSLMRRGR